MCSVYIATQERETVREGEREEERKNERGRERISEVREGEIIKRERMKEREGQK